MDALFGGFNEVTMRYTVKDLRDYIVVINQNLARHGFLNRLEERSRNGYHAVDEYSVDSDGIRTNSGVNRNIVCGTAKQCGDGAELYYYRQHMAKQDANSWS